MLVAAALSYWTLAQAAITCTPGKSSLVLSWERENNTDMYWFALLEGSATGKMYAVETVASSEAQQTGGRLQYVLRGLEADRTYWVQLRSHPASAPSTVWGWRVPHAAIACTTCSDCADTLPAPPAPRVTGTKRTRMWRVSENTYDIDLLSNHNAADYPGQVAFLSGTNDGTFFQLSKVPVTEYCVEHADVPWASYISCNAPEAGTKNTHANPICICMVFADRMQAHQTTAEIGAHCDQQKSTGNGTFDNPTCRCRSADGKNFSEYVVPARSGTHIGRAPVMKPFFYYQRPRESYPVTGVIGENFALPRGGECVNGEEIGTGGCTWRRLPRARVLWGDRLLRHGWNNTEQRFWPLREHGPNITSRIEQNSVAFDSAWRSVSALMQAPEC
eukprot:TRINITY_DN6446_c0_g1_i1.p1 TRINITY_DN6446_c0_g1~~TRINITY_DN6446_c0_g1_i1.p1  ORF type:complete len:389 (+),score=24.83 TRINITY_DN6446_c0_g1_i1:110-1276(+)